MSEVNRRLLKPEIDELALSCILEKYKKFIITQENSCYPSSNLIETADWILYQFKNKNPKHFKIAGKFVNDVLTQIQVGYRIEIPWQKEENILPFWNMGLLYYDDRQWRFPADEFKQLNNHMNKSFENEGCNTFYVVQKASPTLLSMKKSDNFFTKNRYYRSLPYDRYNIVLEQIFMNQKELDKYKEQFVGLRAVLPREILRPIMFVSARLDYFSREK